MVDHDSDNFTSYTVPGTLGVVDHDVVEVSNLHRQILHTEGRIDMPKADSIGEAVTGSVLAIMWGHYCLMCSEQ